MFGCAESTRHDVVDLENSRDGCVGADRGSPSRPIRIGQERVEPHGRGETDDLDLGSAIDAAQASFQSAVVSGEQVEHRILVTSPVRDSSLAHLDDNSEEKIGVGHG